MRLEEHGVITDHDVMYAAPDEHHQPADAGRFSLNGVAIGAASAYEHRIDIGSGHKVVTAILRGNKNVTLIGYAGVWVVGSDVYGECSANGLEPYGAGGYLSCYVGGYSRLHGDAYLSGNWSVFGSNVYLRDVWIDGSDLVLEFYNPGGAPSSVYAWGSYLVK